VIEHVPDPIALLKWVAAGFAGRKVILGTPNSGSLNRLVSGRKWINWHITVSLAITITRDRSSGSPNKRLQSLEVRTITPNLWTILQLRAYGDETV